MDLKLLQEPLTAGEIELRVGATSAAKEKVSLLLYKTARTDRNKLDKVCGPLNWQNKHYNDSHGNIVCGISIWDKDKSEWVTKYDVGVESKTEKEKGSYSDSFKRAGFRWGIGVKLYDAPAIWVEWHDWYEKNGKKYPRIYPQNFSIVMENEKKGIKGGFSILDNRGNLIWGKGVKPVKMPEKLDYLKEIKMIWKDPKFKPFKKELAEKYGGSPSTLPPTELKYFYEDCKKKIAGK